MAIICLGEVVAQGNPTELIQRVQGKIWKKMINKKELDNYKSNFQVISTHLKAGSTVIHVYNETRPDETFEPSPANLEDVYFTEIAARLNEVTV
jgi:ABC-type multidrug transport system ATPase subunit